MKKVKQLTIKENEWGKGSLYDAAEGSYCMLGFLGRGMGCSNEEMANEMWLHGLIDDVPSWLLGKKLSNEEKSSILERLLKYDLSFEDTVIEINDADYLNKEDKKIALKKLFKLVDVDLHFKK